jgi:hypothetical protein
MFPHAKQTAPSLMNSSIKLCLHNQDITSGSVQPVIPKHGSRCGVSGQLHALAFNPLNTRVCVPQLHPECCGEQISLLSLPAMNTIHWTSKFLNPTVLILRQFSHMSFKHRYDYQGLWFFHYLKKSNKCSWI